MKNLRTTVGAPAAIIAFEAAGRHLNFSRAAEELNVSQPAVSRQIHNLESHIGYPLFHRHGNKVRLTEQGRLLFSTTTESFRQIVATVERIGVRAVEKRLVIRSQPILLSTFILPLMADMQRAFPGFLFDIQAMENAARIEDETPNIAILYGDGRWPGLESDILFNDIYFPICHPLMLKDLKADNQRRFLDRLPLMEISNFIDPWMQWRRWGEHFGIEGLKTRRPQFFNDYEMLLRGCRAGQGVAMGALHFVHEQLQEGSLVRLTDLTIRSDFGFYFVHDPKLLSSGFSAVLTWLQEKARETHERCLKLMADEESGFKLAMG